MDWNGGGGSNLKAFGTTRPVDSSSFSFLYNCNYDQYSGMEVRHQDMSMSTETLHGMVQGTDKNMNGYGNMSMEKKKRLTNDQLESLERSFLEEIKLDPDRKMKLSRELGLQPRQIAVWFQNRRARWKTKQLERLYDGLKQEFDAISREKMRLQEEVLKLKSMLSREQGGGTMRKQVMTSTDVSGEETVESTSEAIRSSSNNTMIKPRSRSGAECSYMFSVEDYSNNNVSSLPNYWGGVGVGVPLLPPSFP